MNNTQKALINQDVCEQTTPNLGITQSSGLDENTAVQLQSTTVAGFTFTNTYTDTGRALKLTKIVNAPDTTGSFTFTVSYTDAGGNLQKSVILKTTSRPPSRASPGVLRSP